VPSEARTQLKITAN